ncbi:MAG: hypothetical protein VX034_02360 [Planctomycetota bacterium]|nr:hypothetical protein [Planctomycetota bacterium]
MSQGNFQRDAQVKTDRFSQVVETSEARIRRQNHADNFLGKNFLNERVFRANPDRLWRRVITISRL